jgi:hypothetical protein
MDETIFVNSLELSCKLTINILIHQSINQTDYIKLHDRPYANYGHLNRQNLT